MMGAWSLPLLPTNGLDRSLHAPVIVGLVFVSLFTEVFGWTYAGLVVPGYLAATFAAAPLTAVLVLLEGCLTHGGVALLARIIPERTAAWSTSFGRERFFLYIVVAVVVRLFVEGTLVPYATLQLGFTHHREFYSIGLVLVPLIANVFWSSGLWHTGPRLLVVTGLTWVVVDLLLLRHTNFSLSRFQVANESVALHFLDTPKAYLLLLVGAMLGARGNVKYGWDYNGILVPALLAVAWYEPIRLLGTMLEATALYLLARLLTAVPPFSRMAIVGLRRMLFVGLLGFVVKFALGHGLVLFAPKVLLTDFLGFGYILPSLLAVKMWNKGKIGIVLMPTLQVSLSAFVLGNALGFALSLLFGPSAAQAQKLPPVTRTANVARTWLLLSEEPPTRSSDCASNEPRFGLASVVATLLSGTPPTPSTLSRLDEAGLELVRDPGDYLLIGPKNGDTTDCPGPRLLLSPSYYRRGQRLVVTTKSDPAAAVVSLGLGEANEAPIVLMRSTNTVVATQERQLLADFDKTFTRLELEFGSATSPDSKTRAELAAIGEIPHHVQVRRLEAMLGERLSLAFVDEQRATYATLRLTPELGEQVAARRLQAPEAERVTGSLRVHIANHVDQLVTRDYRPPGVKELALLSNTVLKSFDHATEPKPWVLAVAQTLGYRVQLNDEGRGKTFILYEPEQAERRGNATLIVRPTAKRNLAIEVPAPLWEQGTLSYGLALFEAEQARYLLFSGAKADSMPDGIADPRRSQGRVSYFQRIHESLLGNGANVAAIHGMRPDIPIAVDLVAELTYPLLTASQQLGFVDELLSHLANSGLTSSYYRATLDQVSIGAQADPAFAFAERFAPNRMVRLWFSQGAREKTPKLPPDLRTLERVLDRSPADLDLARFTFDGLASLSRSANEEPMSSACNVELVAAELERWLLRNNPFDRIAARRFGQTCLVKAGLDVSTKTPWIAVVGPGKARLIPLHSPEIVGKHTQPLRDVEQVRRAIDMGVSSIIVETP